METFLVYVGQRVTIETIFRLNGVPTDPTIISVTASSPSGVTSTVTYPDTNMVKNSTGSYDTSILVDEVGTWAFRAEGAGVVDAVNEYLMPVVASNIGAM